MSMILKKIAEFFGLKPPEQPAMERVLEMEQQDDQYYNMATMSGEMEMVPIEAEERKTRGQSHEM